MKSIIDLIYDNDFFRITDNSSLSAEYKSAVDRLCAAEKQLLENFPECAEIFGEYQDAQIDVTCLAARSKFAKGMRVGAQLMLELIKPLK
ncbi:MAG: myb domain-containing protein [Ruminococcus sp.]|nr:myb domain-containing protein [Ruminococcus sp.]